jgi:hypothetical protein
MKPGKSNHIHSAHLFGAAILLLVIFGNAVSAGDFSFYSIGRGLYYDQTGGGAPLAKAPYAGLFITEVVPVANHVNSVAVTLPTGGHVFPTHSFGQPYFSWDRAIDQVALETGFPNGNYTFQISTFSSGFVYLTNTISSGSYPNAPSVANLVAAQSVDAANDFVLVWDAFTAGTTADFISCQLQSVSSAPFATPVFGAPGALDGTATSVTIPAGTLQSGRAYLGRVVFARVQAIYTNTQQAASGATFLFSQTDFWLKTAGPGDNTPPAIAWTTPTNGATGLQWNTPIAVYFTKSMGPAASLVDLNAVGGGVSTIYVGPGAEAVLTFASGGAGHHTLLFNPLNGPLRFGDLNGNPLAAETYVLSYTNSANYMTPVRALLSNPRPQANGTFVIELQGQTNYPYTLQYSSNLVTWSTVGTRPAYDGTAQFVVTNRVPPGLPSVYRAVTQ